MVGKQARRNSKESQAIPSKWMNYVFYDIHSYRHGRGSLKKSKMRVIQGWCSFYRAYLWKAHYFMMSKCNKLTYRHPLLNIIFTSVNLLFKIQIGSNSLVKRHYPSKLNIWRSMISNTYLTERHMFTATLSIIVLKWKLPDCSSTVE